MVSRTRSSELRRRRLAMRNWANLVEWPLAVAAVAFIVAYSWQVIGDLDGTGNAIAEVVVNVTWLCFLIDYVVRLVLAPQRWLWFRTHLLQLAMVALPVLRPLRVLQVMRAFEALQRRTGSMVRGRVMAYAGVTAALLLYSAAISVLDAERGYGTIETLPDALWWAFVTVTTVGYGDYFPVTPIGRIVAVGLMLGGIALIGLVTATIASWIVERVGRAEDAERAATAAHVDALREDIAQLRALIETGGTPEAEKAQRRKPSRSMSER